MIKVYLEATKIHVSRCTYCKTTLTNLGENKSICPYCGSDIEYIGNLITGPHPIDTSNSCGCGQDHLHKVTLLDYRKGLFCFECGYFKEKEEEFTKK